ncbi:MAG: hypothetical protein ACUZ8H_13105 [Candidatus Anammoxibacter sp.]
MKIELKKSYKIGAKTFKKGTELIVINSLAKKLIQKDIAFTKDFISLQEIEAAKISKEKAIETIEELPDNAKKRVSEIPKISNVIVLEYLLGDTRSTVREAASKRIEEIGH